MMMRVAVLLALVACSLVHQLQAYGRPGGLSLEKPANDEVQEMILDLKPEIENLLGRTVSDLEVISYKTQVVAGFNYFVKVKVDDADYIHMRIYKQFNGQTTIHGLQTEKTADEEIEYF